MRRRNVWRWRLAVIGAAALCWTGPAAHADLGGTVTFTEPAASLVFPWDATSGKASFAIVSRGGVPQTSKAIATHWAYWAADCKHLADVVICLTPRDTIVVDPTALQGEVQQGAKNVKTGPVIDLSGQRGLATVTAYQADGSCRIADVPVPLDQAIVGSWTIANTKTNSAFGGEAIGFPNSGDFPDPAILEAGLRIPTLNPETLGDSQVIVLPVRFPFGNAQFASTEPGPLRGVTCDSAFVDNLENSTSLPSVTYKCAGFNPISAATAVEKGDPPIIPDTFTLNSSGFLQFSNCRLATGPITGKRFIFAFHGQTVGPFGTVAIGKYTNLFGQD
jgi:hypothetical protein